MAQVNQELQTAIYSAMWKISNTDTKHRKILAQLNILNRTVNEISLEHKNNTQHLYKNIKLIPHNTALQFVLNTHVMKNQLNMDELIRNYRAIETTILSAIQEEKYEKRNLESSMEDHLKRFLGVVTQNVITQNAPQ